MFGSMGQTNVKNLGNGGTMDGDVTITGDLTVSGGIGLSLSEVIQGTSTIDITNTEAFLVRKNGDGGDVFVVDTTNRRVGLNIAPSASLDIRGDDLFIGNSATDASSRIMFVELASDRTQGFSLLYAGSSNPTLGGQSFTASANTFNIFRHNGTAGGENVLSINRTDGNATFSGVTTLQGNNGNASHTLLKIHNNDVTSNVETGQTAEIEFNFEGTTDGGSNFVTKNAGKIVAGKETDYFTTSADNMDSFLAFYTSQDNVNTLALTLGSDQSATFANDILGADGSNSSPSFSFSSDTDTGMYREGTNEIGFATSGSRALKLDASLNAVFSGDIYVNNSTPAINLQDSDGSNQTLEILHSGANAFFTSRNGSSNGAFFFRSYNGSTYSTALELDSSQNATFAGAITSGGNVNIPAGNLLYLDGGTDTYIYQETDNKISFATNSGVRLSIDNSSATFAGNLALSASSPQINFSGSAGDYGTFGYTEGDPDVFKWGLFQNSGQLASITIDAVSEASPSARFRFNVGGDTDSAIVIDSSKRVGIGTDSPGTVLSISNSTPKITLTDSDVSTSVSLDGSGGIVKLASHTGQSVRFLIGSTEVSRLDSSGNLGIGVTPTTKLELGGGTSGETLLFSNTGVNTTNGARVQANIRYKTGSYAGQNTIQIITETQYDDSSAVVFNTGGSSLERLRITSGGNIGISQNTPTDKLHITGGGIKIEGSSHSSAISFAGADGTVDGLVFAQSGSIGFLDAGSSYMIECDNDDSIKFSVTDSQKMKIDTNSVISLSNNDSGTSNTIFGKTAGDSDGAGDFNVFVGELSGGTGTQTDACDFNVAIGYNAYTNVTQGTNSTIVGAMAGDAVTTTKDLTLVGKSAGTNINHSDADGTTAIGLSALELLTNGRYNCAVGYKSLETSANGDKNTAVGYQSLGDVTGSSDGENTAIGFNAGHTGTNNLTSGTKNTMIGASTQATASGAVNQTVIGYGAIGQQNNSVTLGNADVTDIFMGSDSGALVNCSGIAFPATQVASGGANALDDYEEGTFTPAIFYQNSDDMTNSANVTQTGVYTKIGNMCHIQIYFKWSATDPRAGDNIAITGMPFTAKNTTSLRPVFPVVVNGSSLSTSDVIIGIINVNTTVMYLQGGNGNEESNMGDDFGENNNMEVVISGTFIVE